MRKTMKLAALLAAVLPLALAGCQEEPADPRDAVLGEWRVVSSSYTYESRDTNGNLLDRESGTDAYAAGMSLYVSEWMGGKVYMTGVGTALMDYDNPIFLRVGADGSLTSGGVEYNMSGFDFGTFTVTAQAQGNSMDLRMVWDSFIYEYGYFSTQTTNAKLTKVTE